MRLLQHNGEIIELYVVLFNRQKNQMKSIKNMSKPPTRLLDQVREKIRLRHHSIRIEQAYVSWIRRYILLHSKKNPKDIG